MHTDEQYVSKKCRYACISLKSTCVAVSFDMVGRCYFMVTVYKYGCEAWQTMELYQLQNLKVHQTHFYTIKWVSLELYFEGDSKSKRIKKKYQLCVELFKKQWNKAKSSDIKQKGKKL